jgi:hypothetical protein
MTWRRAAATAFAVLAMPGPARATVATDVCPASANPCVVSTNVVATTGSTLDFGARTLVIAQNRRIEVAGPGTLTIIAGAVTVEPGGQLRGSSTSRVGGSITVQAAGDILFQRSGTTRSQSDVSSPLTGGSLTLIAGGNVVVDGDLLGRGTTVDADGGALTVTAGGSVRVGGDIRFPGGLGAFGGTVTIEAAGEVRVATATPPQIVDASGGINGGDITFTAGPLIDTAARLDLGATGASGDGGFLTLTADGDIVLRGLVAGSASGTILEGGGFGADVSITAGGSFHILDRIDISGAVPDGEGGVLDAGAGVDIVQNGQILAQGPGTESFGGNLFLVAGRLLHLNALVDLHGGDLGGAGLLTAQADDEVRASAEVNADGDAGFIQLTTAGTGGLLGRLVHVDATAFLHARSAPTGLGGVVIVQGCGVAVTTGARLISQGRQSENQVQVSGPGSESTIMGTLTSSVTNRVEYLTSAPSLVGGTFAPAAALTQLPSLAACRAPGPTTTSTSTSTSTSTTTSTSTSTTATVPTTSSTVVVPPTSTTSTSSSATTSSVATTSSTSSSTSTSSTSSSTSTSSTSSSTSTSSTSSSTSTSSTSSSTATSSTSSSTSTSSTVSSTSSSTSTTASSTTTSTSTTSSTSVPSSSTTTTTAAPPSSPSTTLPAPGCVGLEPFATAICDLGALQRETLCGDEEVDAPLAEKVATLLGRAEDRLRQAEAAAKRRDVNRHVRAARKALAQAKRAAHRGVRGEKLSASCDARLGQRLETLRDQVGGLRL